MPLTSTQRRAKCNPFLISICITLFPLSSIIWGVRQRSWTISVVPYLFLYILEVIGVDRYKVRGNIHPNTYILGLIFIGLISLIMSIIIKRQAIRKLSDRGNKDNTKWIGELISKIYKPFITKDNPIVRGVIIFVIGMTLVNSDIPLYILADIPSKICNAISNILTLNYDLFGNCWRGNCDYMTKYSICHDLYRFTWNGSSMNGLFRLCIVWASISAGMSRYRYLKENSKK
tara:strand:- start:354 stop:1046 length:693 start_codon:yes stop_codon:yes gene_type:complete